MTSRLPRRRRGFTAIELTAVATIIAIIALILIPIVRKRVDQTRLVAAADDMKTIETAQTLANADTGFYFRLCDLDNGPADLDDLSDPVAIAGVPRAYWNALIIPLVTSDTPIVQMWNGPYTTFNRTKFVYMDTLRGARPGILRTINSSGSPGSSVGEGPILALEIGTDAWTNDFAAGNNNKYPVDPWGNPYIFFGPGRINNPNGGSPAITPADETNFGNAAVYSMGPDGEPGSLPAGIAESNPELYFRESGQLGNETTDDLYRYF